VTNTQKATTFSKTWTPRTVWFGKILSDESNWS
jgi:hypothetical protein